MLISRGSRLLKNVVTAVSTRNNVKTAVPSRASGGTYVYRDVPMAMKRDIIGAEVLGGFMWWWIFWHAWHYWGHIVGEYEYPDPLLWTDEELGIPPEED